MPPPNITPADLANRFAYHAPTGGKKEKHENIRNECHELAKKIVATVPPGREQSTAISKLEEVMVWANAGIARHPEVQPPEQVDTAALAPAGEPDTKLADEPAREAVPAGDAD